MTQCGGERVIADFNGFNRPFKRSPYWTFYLEKENSTGKSNYDSLQASPRITGCQDSRVNRRRTRLIQSKNRHSLCACDPTSPPSSALLPLDR
jgi:hypothetical protein